jgi:hypothetical protein
MGEKAQQLLPCLVGLRQRLHDPVVEHAGVLVPVDLGAGLLGVRAQPVGALDSSTGSDGSTTAPLPG